MKKCSLARFDNIANHYNECSYYIFNKDEWNRVSRLWSMKMDSLHVVKGHDWNTGEIFTRIQIKGMDTWDEDITSRHIQPAGDNCDFPNSHILHGITRSGNDIFMFYDELHQDFGLLMFINANAQ